jgi:hypothetical protein
MDHPEKLVSRTSLHLLPACSLPRLYAPGPPEVKNEQTRSAILNTEGAVERSEVDSHR